MRKQSPWNTVLAPFYSETGLVRHGLEVTEDLITLHTADGQVVYPHAQFNVLPDSNLQKRLEVIQLWNTLIRPAILDGSIDEWSATGLLLQETADHPSYASIIAADNSEAERIGRQIGLAVSRWRQ